MDNLDFTPLPWLMAPKISVVTVVYNCASTIEATLQSVASQTYSCLEYIVIDGGSDDGTLRSIQQYSRYIDYFVSESDSGVYHAMNKAIKVASGDWILFMNSGDIFASATVIEDVFKSSFYDYNVFIYGGHQVFYGNGRVRTVPAKSRLNLWRGSQICHQSAFIPLSYHKVYNYDLKYKIASDYAFFLEARRRGVVFKPISLHISTITAQGLSDVQRIKGISELSMALNNKFLGILYFPLLIVRTLLIQVIKRAIRVSIV